MEACWMRVYLTILALLPLGIIGVSMLVFAERGETAAIQDPCPGSFAVYVDGSFVECMDSEQKYKAYP